ncbi:MAG: diguanylate cyclase [Nitrospinota bacterium]|nr:diguanylate cyclase [Nitrospinota bacterium]
MIAIFLLDINLPLGVAAGVPYLAPVLLSLWVPSRRFVIGAALAGSILTIIGFFASPPGGELWVVLANRLLALFAIWLTAALILVSKKWEKEAEKLSLFPRENPNPVLQVRKDGYITYANPVSGPLLELLECRQGDYLSGKCLDIIRQSSESGAPKEFEYEVGIKIFSILATPVDGGDSVFVYAVDITENKQAQRKARIATSVFESMKEGVMVTDKGGAIQFVNPAFTTITGYEMDEALGKKSNFLKSGRHDSMFYQRMWATISEKGEWCGEIWNKRKSGELFPSRLTITAIRGSGGVVSHYAGVFYDITDIKRREEDVRYQAYHDPLTGLPNRLLFVDRTKRAIARAHRNKTLVAIMFLDMDYFKNINDSYGHDTGDMLLKAVGMRLVGALRESDTVSRFGGDEFTILLEDIKSPAEAMKAAAKVMEALSETYSHNGSVLQVTPSVGVSIYPIDATCERTLMKHADRALYKTKRSGRKGYRLYSSTMGE